MPVTPDAINAMLADRWPTATARCTAVSATHATAELVPGPSDLRPGAMFSGPVQFAAADSAFWFAVSGALGRVEPMAVTAEMAIRFLRPAVGERLHAHATVDHRGRTRVVATVRVWTDDPDRPCAVAQGTYALPRGARTA